MGTALAAIKNKPSLGEMDTQRHAADAGGAAVAAAAAAAAIGPRRRRSSSGGEDVGGAQSTEGATLAGNYTQRDHSPETRRGGNVPRDPLGGLGEG